MSLTEKASFKVGQVVRLNSGGPEMTVTDVKAGYVATAWFSTGDEIKEATFWPETISLV